MNKPLPLTLSNALVNNLASNNAASQSSPLPGAVLAAKNIQFAKDAITLDVMLDKQWQTLRLGTTNTAQHKVKIANANIQLSANGKQLTITPHNTSLTLTQPAQLQRLFNYINSGYEHHNNPMPAQVVQAPTPQLLINKLNVSIAINKQVAQLLVAEQPLKVMINSHSQGTQLDVINRFADIVHSQALTQTKLTALLAQLLPNPQLQTHGKTAALSHPAMPGAFSINITTKQRNELPTTAVNATITQHANKLIINTALKPIAVTLNNSFSNAFNNIASTQPGTQQTHTLASPLLASVNSPINSWLKGSVADLKTRITDAVSYFQHKPFAYNDKGGLLKPFATANKLMLSSPFAAKPLLNPAEIADLADAHSKPLLSRQINDITNKLTQQSPDLTRLVNHAFNRIISSNNLQPTTIQREILATLQPSLLSSNALQSSFSKGLEHLAVSVLAAPAISQAPAAISVPNHSGLDALLQLLLPTFKTANSAKLLEQLQQANVQALAGELTNIKNTLSQVQLTATQQQSDSNPLVNFLLPMKLPPDAAQTELTVGQYNKPKADKQAGKSVWFVRLNFDYGAVGQLQIIAELMDKALDCQLVASSQAITALAHPQLDNLRSKLAKHGLQVGELTLQQAEAHHDSFYQSHAIINIKV